MKTRTAIRRSFVVALPSALAFAAACGSFSSAEEEETTPPTTTEAGPTSDGPTSTEDAPPADCGDTISNSQNCGRCGHSCVGGACVASKCQPVAIATAPAEVPWLVTDATRVIWSTGLPQLGGLGTVFACAKATGCPASGPTSLAANFFVGTLGSDGTKAYVTKAAGGGAGILEVGPTDLVPLAGLTMNGLLWITPRNGVVLVNAYYQNDASGYSRTILRANLPNGPFQPVSEYLPVDPTNTAATTFSKDWVYIGAHNVPKIVAAPLAGGPFVDVVTGGDTYVWSLTSDDERIYFTSGGGSPVYSCVANGQPCQPRPDLLAGEGITGKPRTLHLSGGRLFIETSDGELASCDPTSCKTTIEVLAKETAFDDRWRHSGTNIAVDAQSVYYVAREGVDDASFTYVVKRVARGLEK